METSPSIGALAAALAAAQGAMDGAAKSSANPFFKSKYADLSSVWDACREALSANGLAVLQSPHAQGATVSVTTLLLHTSGEWVKGTVTATAKDDSPQSVGSIITYLRRYSLQSFAGVAPEDDDAEAAQGRRKPPTTDAKPPAGYAQWLDDFKTTALDGSKAIAAAWKATPEPIRAWAQQQDAAALKAVKETAATATADAKEPTA